MSVASRSSRVVADKKKKKAGKSYLQELKDELRKVSWTTKDELRTSSKIVIGAIFAFGVGIYITDLVVKGALDSVSLLVKLLWG